MRVVVDDGKERDSANDMGNPGRSVGSDSPGHFGNGSPQVHGAQEGSSEANPGRHHFPDAQRLPVEPCAPGAG